MSSTASVKKLLDEFKAAYKMVEKNTSISAHQKRCREALAKIKIAMLEFDFDEPGNTDSKTLKQQLTISRESLELATFFSVMTQDIASFERHVAQTKVFYSDYSTLLLESPRKFTILGLHLMYLLAHNKLSEFHTELELIPLQNRKQLYIAYPVELEQRLMEGSYSKVLIAKKSVPSTHYNYFMDILVDTVRERISDCSMKAYNHVPVNKGRKLLLLDSDKQLKAYVEKRGWKIVDGEIHWNKVASKGLELRSQEFIQESLVYATELERIV